MNRIALVILALVATSTAASASDDSRRDYINERQAAEKFQIQRARDNGELTWLEKMRLNREQHRIQQLERDAKRDGYVSGYEARRINEALDDAERNIHRQSHNDRVAWWKRW